MDTESPVRVAHDGPITRLTIAREKALNALNAATLAALEAAIDGLPADTRVVILTGAGDRAFVAGADITEMQAFGPAEALAFSQTGPRVLGKLEALDAVVIAQVNGFALGGGCELMLACDFAIASEKAKLGQPEVALGVIPGFGGTTRLVRRVGLARARQLAVTGARIDAAQALAWGLVNEVVAHDALAERVSGLAQEIVQKAPGAVAAAKHATGFAAEAELGAANRYEQQAFALCFATEDQKEGMRAFVEKRAPAWTGR
jgi:enoyl-CoA hydratase